MLFGLSPGLPISVTSLAVAPSLRRYECISLIEFMPTLAMRFVYFLLCRRSNLISFSLRDDFFKWEPGIYSFDDGVSFYAGHFSKINDQVLNAVEGRLERSSLISLLFLSRGPFAIIRRIIEMVVSSFKRVSDWSRSHILSKVTERYLPSFANCYASAAIVLPLFIVFVPASSKHALPNAIERMRVFEWHY